ncbi:putative N-alpha-acetyltransferase 50 [Blattamonas nauphoetae]|uniref:N-alpha-acetyltransferase 50 n=1 Tax=Blattamonas nauphoetae TaxID=2049346 RepID=A0ABQ9XZI1_9EUKA|nr:putative N-alpha-acetyltransferase 50 [Blattamonas nauphoetae]
MIGTHRSEPFLKRKVTVMTKSVDPTSKANIVLLEEPDEDEMKARECLSGGLNKFSFGHPTKKNAGTLKVLNDACLPVHYRQWFYDALFTRDIKLSRLVYFNDNLVGAICCRIENLSDLYIMSITVLAPYRKRKIGSYLMHYIINYTKQHTELKRIYLNVHTPNTSAQNFYKNAFNFSEVRRIDGYYTDLTPSDCFELELKIRD